VTAARELSPRVDEARFRSCMRLLPTGVSLLTAGTGDDVIGMTVNSVVSVSVAPPTLLVSVHRQARLLAVAPVGAAFAVGFLDGEGIPLSRQFAAANRPVGTAAVVAMAGRPGTTGVPVPGHALGVVECVVREVIPVGDHVLLIGAVVDAEARGHGRVPQIFYEGELLAGDVRTGRTG
jgi:flavin reductase